MSVLHVHGTADDVILYEGAETGPYPKGDGERAFYAGAEEMVTRWSRRAGCDWPEDRQPHATLDLDQYVPGPETQAFSPGFPILGVFRLKGQPKRDSGSIVRSCKASQSPVYPIRDAFAVVEHPSCPSSSSSCPLPVG